MVNFLETSVISSGGSTNELKITTAKFELQSALRQHFKSSKMVASQKSIVPWPVVAASFTLQNLSREMVRQRNFLNAQIADFPNLKDGTEFKNFPED